MSKGIAEVTTHPLRYAALAMIAIAIAMLALLLSRTDTEAVHNEALLEVDGNEAYDGGSGFNPGTGNCNPFVFANGAPVDCINTPASFDWADGPAAGNQGLCARAADGYITEASSLPSVPAGASIDDLICQADFYQGSTKDTSYHTGSDKDYQDLSGPEPVWHCVDLSNATGKADLLNAMFAVTTTATGDQVLYFGAERDVEHGSVFNGYWILQSDVGVDVSANDPNNGVGAGGQLDCGVDDPRNFTGVHVCGDVLILFNYESGGRVGKIGAFQWVPNDSIVGLPAGDIGCDRDGDGVADATCTTAEQADGDTVGLSPGPGFLCTKFTAGSGDCRATLSFGDDLCGRVNGATDCSIAPKKTDPNPPPCSGPGTFSAPWEPKDGDPASAVLEPPTFSEVGVNLSDLNLELPCIAGLVAESRSSPSTTATLKDFVAAPTGADCESTARTEIHSNAADGTDITGSTVVAGTIVHDHAFVTPTGAGPDATGTVTYTLFNNTTCTPGTANANVISTQTVTISPGIPSGTESTTQVPASNNYTTVAGTSISYLATVDLDDPYADSVAACEPLTVINPALALDKDAAPVATVTYSYQLSNSGDVDLTSPSVTDDKCSPAQVTSGGFNTGDANTNGEFDPGETWNFACSTPISLTSGVALVNTATGTAVDPLNNTLTKVDVVTTTATLVVSDPNGE